MRNLFLLIVKCQSMSWNKFQVSAAETEDQDIRQSIVIAAASIAAHSAQADSIMDEIVRFVEQNTEAEIVGEEREIR